MIHPQTILPLNIILHWITIGVIHHKDITLKDHIRMDMYISHVALIMQSKDGHQVQLVLHIISKVDTIIAEAINHIMLEIIITKMVALPQETKEVEIMYVPNHLAISSQH